MKLSMDRPELVISALVGHHFSGVELRDQAIEALRMQLLRQAARRLAPARRQTLVQAVATSLSALADEDQGGSAAIDQDLDALIGAGDLLVAKSHEAGGSDWLLFPSPPVFIRRSRSKVFILGAATDTDLFAENARFWGPYRELAPGPSVEDLINRGLTELPLDVWLARPRDSSVDEVVTRLRAALDEANQAGELRELTVLDPARPQRYYRGRFVTPRMETGSFLGHRGRKWGGSRWVYVELSNGVPLRFVDLPVVDPRFTGLDEARWLICALDASGGTPQRVRVERSSNSAVLAFETPLPGWAERRLLTVGEISPARPVGSLMAIVIGDKEIAQDELEFLRVSLWMEVIEQ